MRRRTFLRCLAVLPLVPFLHAPVHQSLAEVLAASFLKKLNRPPYGTSRWVHAHCAIYPNGKLRWIPITGRFTS